MALRLAMTMVKPSNPYIQHSSSEYQLYMCQWYDNYSSAKMNGKIIEGLITRLISGGMKTPIKSKLKKLLLDKYSLYPLIQLSMLSYIMKCAKYTLFEYSMHC